MQISEVGVGRVEATGSVTRLSLTDALASAYSNAQLDDYAGLPRGSMRWHPPLTLSVRTRFSHASGELRGTAGFGFWNDPFGGSIRRLPTLPQALWFFYAAPPSDMRLDLHAAGHGWKAATFDARRRLFLLLAPLAPLALPLMRLPALYRALWPIGQAALGIREAALGVDMRAWHTYSLHWRRDGASFSIDGVRVLESRFAPKGPLGFVLWIDNQYAVVTPQGVLRGGLVHAPGRQWIEVGALEIV